MGSKGNDREELLRERAYLALLLLVGGGAILVGGYQTVRSGTVPMSAIFDLALGTCVLLVTWLFLAPSAWPALFGDGEPRSGAEQRPYLGPNPSPLLAAPRPRRREAATPGPTASKAPSAPSAIPRWADPLVQPRVDGPARPFNVSAPMASAGAFPAIPRA